MSRKCAYVGVLLMAFGAALVGAAVLPRPTAALQGRQVETEGRQHVEIGMPITYYSRPPSSGPHYDRTLRYGVFEREVEPGYWVHTLEHGGIVLLYNCAEPCPNLIEGLRQIYASAPTSQRYHIVKMAAVPHRDMEHRVAAVAWSYVDEMDALDNERILSFYAAHVDRGPEDAL